MMLDPAYRHAAKYLHPDAGGDPEQFRRLQIAKAVPDEERTRHPAEGA